MDDLISLCYAGAEDSAHWKDFLAAFSSKFGLLWSSFRIHDSRNNETVLGFVAGPSENARREYTQKWVEQDPWVRSLSSDELELGRIYGSEQLVDESTLKQSRAYRDFFEPRDVSFSGGVVLARTPSSAATLSFFRAREHGPLAPSEARLIEPVIPHFQRALRLHIQQYTLQQRHEAALAQIDDLAHGLVLLESDGTVVLANAAARQVIGAGRAARISKDKFRFLDPQADGHLQTALDHFGRGLPPDAKLARRFVLPVEGRRQHLFLIGPVTPGQAVASGTPAVSILVVSPESRLRLSTNSLTELFDLTPTQARIASLLATGSSVFEIAAELEIKTSTVRSHLKHVFEKTNTERQAELVLLLSRFATWKGE